MQKAENKAAGKEAMERGQAAGQETAGNEAMEKEQAVGNEVPESGAMEKRQAVGRKTAESKAMEKGQTAGQETADNDTVTDVVVRDNTGRKKRLLILLGAVVILLAAVIIGISAFGGSERKLQEQLDLGAKYLEEMDYEQALVAFNAALTIEPKNVDAYLGIVEVYIRTNEFELALETAKEGYEVTGDERLKEKIDMIESGDIFASNGWIMKMSGYDGAGNLVFWYEYTYNLKGQEASVANYNAQGKKEQYLEPTYDEEGRSLIYYAIIYPEGDLSKSVREYSGDNYRETWYVGTSDKISGYTDVEADSDGNILKETSYGEDGSVWGADIFEYDEENRLIKVSFYNSNNELNEYHVYTYDEDGKGRQTKFYDSDNTLRGYTEVIYDDEGNYIGERQYDSEGVLYSEQIKQ